MEVVVVGGLLTFHLKLDKFVVDLLKLAIVILKPSLPENSGVEPPNELEGEVEGIRGRFSFLMLLRWEGEGKHRER